MQPITKKRSPSFWSGLAALDYPFGDTADYSRWACMLIERGYDGDAICVLAGMEDEVNLFVLREWLHKAMLDLGVKPLDDADALAAHARGIMEDFLTGYLTFKELLQKLCDLDFGIWDNRLEPFCELQYALYEFEYADWGMKSIKEIPERAKSECLAFIQKHQAELETNPVFQCFAYIQPEINS